MSINKFINPIAWCSERLLIIIGIIATLIAALMCYYFDAVLDGVLDLHPGKATLLQHLGYNAINIVLLFALLFFVGKIVNRRTRIIDILNTVLVSRIAFYIILPFFWLLNIQEETNKLMSDISNPEALQQSLGLGVLAFSLVSIAAVVLFIIMLFKGFKTATNASSTKSYILFGLAVFAAEVISKIIFNQII